jgi:hypothetical protein
VAARKARGEVNVPPPSPGRSYRQIILGNIFSFINNVFYVRACCWCFSDALWTRSSRWWWC